MQGNGWPQRGPNRQWFFYNNKEIKSIELFFEYVTKVLDGTGDLPLIIGGDLNSRTGMLNDTLITDNLLDFLPYDNPSEILNDDLCLPARLSADEETNYFGKLLIDFCKESNLFIANGRTNGDIPGKIT